MSHNWLRSLERALQAGPVVVVGDEEHVLVEVEEVVD